MKTGKENGKNLVSFSCVKDTSTQKIRDAQIHRQTDRRIYTKVKTEDTLSGFQELSFDLSSRIDPIKTSSTTCCSYVPDTGFFTFKYILGCKDDK